MEDIITSFYQAFQQKDAAKMNACYHDDIEFEDPAFGKLKGEDAKCMWEMLCKNAVNFKLEFSDIKSIDNSGSAHWEAWYDFSRTGKRVHNIIDASFELKDGKIIKHHDHFNLHRWATQAMGWKGWLLGGTSFFKKKLHEQSGKALERYKLKKV
ncbi:nuclear transport factor 2 family protein [Chondrinema litorale]|uniref:nuclear transport factor 2 family protein n=1 Tax=Chondrinema litorale TaxID=2994555 RepID=UPI002542FD6C|nr:nuclear transport factor 2 family protein [Chondrinema litorale]UZR92353.1 nuclear transport factor 2 family protein [Chondrinema litorale]